MNTIKTKTKKVTLVDPTTLVAHPRNPNQHGDTQVEAIVKVLKYQGWRAPVVVSKRSGFIISGHARVLAALKMGLEKVPVDYQEFENEAEEWAHLIADNRLSSLSEMDGNDLAGLLKDLETGDISLEAAGYTKNELADLLSVLEPMEYTTDGIKEKHIGNKNRFEQMYATTDIRQIVLVFDKGEYEEITGMVETLKEEKSLSSNTEAFAFALRESVRGIK